MKRLEELSDTRSHMISIFKDLIKNAEDKKELFKSYLSYPMKNIVSLNNKEIESGFYSLGSKIIKLGQNEDEIRKDLPEYMLKDFFEFIFIEILKRFFIEEKEFNASVVIEKYVDLFIDSAGKEM